MILDAVDTDALDMTEEQKNVMAVINHQMVLQDQFNQLTKHVENIYSKLKVLETALANKVLS